MNAEAIKRITDRVAFLEQVGAQESVEYRLLKKLALLESQPEPGDFTRPLREAWQKAADEIERLKAIMHEHHICARCGKRLSDTEWRSVHTCYHYEPKGDSKG